MAAWDKRDDMLVHGQDPFNAEPVPTALYGHDLTPVEAFYTRNHGKVPVADPEQWRLVVDGLVGTALRLCLDDLRTGFEPRSLVATLQCAGNRRAEMAAVREIVGEDPWQRCATSTARWVGVALTDVLAAAGVGPAARHVAFGAPDVSSLAHPPQTYGASIPLSKATGPEVLLAWEMNDQPLPAVHGAPVRVVVPGYIGARSVKWVDHVSVRSEPSDNYFQATAYRILPPQVDPACAAPGNGISLGPVALNCEILQPGDDDRVSAGPVSIGGYAFAGDDRTVARVDVSVDRGQTWQQATLRPQSGPWAWRLWTATVEVSCGPVTALARAWDSTGALQPESSAALWNPKGYANNSWPHVDFWAD